MQVGYFFPMADETTPEPRDKIADYNEKLAAALALPLEEGFVDPHVEAIGKGKGPDFDVDPRGDPDADVNGSRDFSEDGPSEAELRQGDEEEGEQSGFPSMRTKASRAATMACQPMRTKSSRSFTSRPNSRKNL